MISDTEGHEYLWVKIDPPVSGQSYGLGEKDLTDILLLPHFQGDSLFPVNQFPLPVYVYTASDENVFKDLRAPASTLKMAAWGEIYATREDAERVGTVNEPFE